MNKETTVKIILVETKAVQVMNMESTAIALKITFGMKTTSFHFEGAKLKLGGVLKLRTDKVKKLPYKVFKEILTNHVMTNLGGGKDPKIDILYLKDPFEELQK